MNCRLILLSLSSCIAAPRDLDHIAGSLLLREQWSRGLVTVNLPYPLALKTEDEDIAFNEINVDVNDHIVKNTDELDISNVVNMKTIIPVSPPSTTTTAEIPLEPKIRTSTLPSLEYYYQFIEKNFVDESNRGGNVFTSFQCCHGVRRQG